MRATDSLREGLRAIKPEPTLYLLELLWRWSFGLGAMGILFLSLRPIVNAVQLTQMDQQMLATHNPDMMAGVMGDILADVLPTLARVLAWALPSLAILWAMAVTIGRGVTVRLLVRKFAAESEPARALPEWKAASWRAMAGISVARVVMGLILFIGYAGASLIASGVRGDGEDVGRLLLSAVVFLFVFAAAMFVWAVVDKVLVMSPVFVARDGVDTLTAIAKSLLFVREQKTALREVQRGGVAMEIAFLFVFGAAGLVCIPLANSAPVWVTGGVATALTVVYCAVSDWFALARMGAYAALAVQSSPEAKLQPAAEQA